MSCIHFPISSELYWLLYKTKACQPLVPLLGLLQVSTGHILKPLYLKFAYMCYNRVSIQAVKLHWSEPPLGIKNSLEVGKLGTYSIFISFQGWFGMVYTSRKCKATEFLKILWKTLNVECWCATYHVGLCDDRCVTSILVSLAKIPWQWYFGMLFLALLTLYVCGCQI